MGNSERKKEATRRWQRRHREEARIYARRYREENKDKIQAYRAANKDRIRVRSRDYNRKNILTTGGKHIRVRKREYPEGNVCELCNEVSQRLEYHHWSDEAPQFGLWLCPPCHKAADVFERGSIDKLDKYYQLKKIVEGKPDVVPASLLP